MSIDPYSYADELLKTSADLVSDMASFTVQDLAAILRDAAHFIEHQADEYNSHISRTKVTLSVGHEEIDLTNEILSLFTTEFLQDFVNQAIRAYIGTQKSEAWA